MSLLRWLIVSDVDDTLLGDETSLLTLATILNDHRSRIVIVFNSSRPCASQLARMTPALAQLQPDILLGGLGTECAVLNLAYASVGESQFHWSPENWSREAIVRGLDGIALKLHSQEYQTPYKISFDLEKAADLAKVRSALTEAGAYARLIVSHGTTVDVIPAGAGKRSGVEFMSAALGIPLQTTIVAGDSENDLDMFAEPVSGIVVSNAQPILKALRGDRVYVSELPYAAGVLDGLRYWQVI
ncbi:MAG: HAD-IIB family hydrolase [Chloroflexota bacterium]|nr:HAD-IIB family hydrolase [Chloroflexota bacterium]